MSPGLREKNRLRTMRRVQSAALDLFEELGFDSVSVALIAERADVAERSVYRYFGTKEGIALWHEADVDFLDAVRAELRTYGLRAALRQAAGTIDATFTPAQRAHSARLLALIGSVPSVRAQVADGIAMVGADLGADLARARGLPAGDLACRIAASAAVTALALALQDWGSSQSPAPVSQVLLQALEALDDWGG